MNIQQSVTTCLKDKYATFKGRATRSEYWWFWLFTFVIGIVAGMISSLLAGIINLALLIPTIAAGVRRMHDTGHCGWWLICPIVNIIFAILPSNEGANEYGAPEK